MFDSGWVFTDLSVNTVSVKVVHFCKEWQESDRGLLAFSARPCDLTVIVSNYYVFKRKSHSFCLKGIAHPKEKIMSSLIHPHVVSNPRGGHLLRFFFDGRKSYGTTWGWNNCPCNLLIITFLFGHNLQMQTMIFHHSLYLEYWRINAILMISSCLHNLRCFVIPGLMVLEIYGVSPFAQTPVFSTPFTGIYSHSERQGVGSVYFIKFDNIAQEKRHAWSWMKGKP